MDIEWTHLSYLGAHQYKHPGGWHYYWNKWPFFMSSLFEISNHLGLGYKCWQQSPRLSKWKNHLHWSHWQQGKKFIQNFIRKDKKFKRENECWLAHISLLRCQYYISGTFPNDYSCSTTGEEAWQGSFISGGKWYMRWKNPSVHESRLLRCEMKNRIHRK